MKQEKPAEIMVPFSQLESFINAKVSERMQSEREKAAEEAQTLAEAAKKLAEESKVDVTEVNLKELYGNLDFGKEFNLRKILPSLVSLPDDKFIIVKQKHMVKENGELVEDESARQAQPIDPAVYAQNTLPDKNSGEKIYDVLLGTPGSGRGWVTVHKPSEEAILKSKLQA